jgi:tetratricopeptide (TPR) repeat protein
VLQLGIDGIERRDENNLVGGTDLSCRQTRYLAGYSRRIFGPLTGGLTLKLDRFIQGSYGASGFGADIGFGYENEFASPVIEGLALGLTFSNLLEPTMKLVEEESGDPRGVRAGISIWGPVSGSLEDRFLLAVDLENTRYGDSRFHAGLEYSLEPHLAARLGYDDGFASFGMGFGFSSLEVDYAYRTSDLENYHLFSITVGFGQTRSKRLEERRVAREREIREQIDREILNYERRFVESALRDADIAFSEGRYDESVQLFDKVLLMEPENETALRGKERSELLGKTAQADLLFGGGDFAGALLLYRRMAVRYGNGELDGKIAACEGMISKADDRREMVEKIFERGLELYSDRRWEDAAGVFREVLDLYPGHELANGYLDKSRNRIKEELGRALQRIDELTASRRYGEALEMIRAGIQRYGDSDIFETRLARLRQMQADAEKKKDRLSTATAATRRELSRAELDEIRPVYERGVARFREGKFDGAAEEWEPIWKKHPGYENVADYLVKAYQYWGMELYTKHRYNEALEVWQRILRVDRENEKALRYIRRTREELDRLESLTG